MTRPPTKFHVLAGTPTPRSHWVVILGMHVVGHGSPDPGDDWSLDSFPSPPTEEFHLFHLGPLSAGRQSIHTCENRRVAFGQTAAPTCELVCNTGSLISLSTRSGDILLSTTAIPHIGRNWREAENWGPFNHLGLKFELHEPASKELGSCCSDFTFFCCQ